MMFDGINLIAVAVAAVGSFLFGAVWYAVLGKVWMRSAGLSEEQTKPNFVTFGLTFLCQALMAFIFAGIIYHTGTTSIQAGVISAVMVWAGIVLTTLVVNHRFQRHPWSLTVIDGGHWLGVLLVQGILIGWIS